MGARSAGAARPLVLPESLLALCACAVLAGVTTVEGVCEWVRKLHRRRKPKGKKESRKTVYAVPSPEAHQASPAEIAALVRGQQSIENRDHHVRDTTFVEDASRLRTGAVLRAMATFRKLAIGALRLSSVTDLAKATRINRYEHAQPLPFIGIPQPINGNDAALPEIGRLSNEDGTYGFDLPPGEYELTVHYEEAVSDPQEVTVDSGEDVTVDFEIAVTAGG